MPARLVANRPFSDEELREAVEAFERFGSKTAAAQALTISVDSVKRRISAAAERGMMGTKPVMEGFKITGVSTLQDADGNLDRQWIRQSKDHGQGPEFEVPAGHIIKGVSALIDAEGHEITKWVKTKEDPNQIDWAEIFKTAFAEYEGKAAITAPPANPESDFLNLIPCNDWHINLLCWAREVGQSWDLKIAERTIGDAIETVIGRTRSAGTAVVLGGGDLMHNDDNTNRTAKSHNVLDADGRHAKGIEVAQRLKVRTIEAALKTNQQVIVRILKGNHDEQSAVAIAHFLSAWFRNEPRVTVDLDQSLYWYYRFGSVFLAATHGHAAKLSKMPGIMAHRRPEDWGATRYRYAHGFHIHHKEKMATEGEGVICESHQAPIPQDAWHWNEGYLSGRSVQTITYHKKTGEFGRVIEAIPEQSPAKARREAA